MAVKPLVRSSRMPLSVPLCQAAELIVTRLDQSRLHAPGLITKPVHKAALSHRHIQ